MQRIIGPALSVCDRLHLILNVNGNSCAVKFIKGSESEAVQLRRQGEEELQTVDILDWLTDTFPAQQHAVASSGESSRWCYYSVYKVFIENFTGVWMLTSNFITSSHLATTHKAVCFIIFVYGTSWFYIIKWLEIKKNNHPTTSMSCHNWGCEQTNGELEHRTVLVQRRMRYQLHGPVTTIPSLYGRRQKRHNIRGQDPIWIKKEQTFVNKN